MISFLNLWECFAAEIGAAEERKIQNTAAVQCVLPKLGKKMKRSGLVVGQDWCWAESGNKKILVWVRWILGLGINFKYGELSKCYGLGFGKIILKVYGPKLLVMGLMKLKEIS